MNHEEGAALRGQAAPEEPHAAEDAGADKDVLDQPVLDDLSDELGGRRGAVSFLVLFLELLPGRVHEIVEIARHGQRHPSDVATNLAATSRMIGAHRFARHLSALPLGGGATWSSEERERFVDATRAGAGDLRAAVERYVRSGPEQPRSRRSNLKPSSETD